MVLERERGLRYFPIALFASVMGISGVTLSITLFENAQKMNHLTSMFFLILASLLFIFNASIFVYRLIRFKEDVKREFNHPIKMNFFAAISISMLLLSIPYYQINESLSFFVWFIGTILQVYFTLVILSKLIWKSNFQMAQFNPTWFIPIVGNLLVPLAGTSHVSADINWIFFSLGILFTILFMALFFQRVFFYPQIPEKITPTFFILLAPPAIGTISYMKLVGNLDVFAYILYGIAFYLGLLLLFQYKRFFSIPFSVSWWAYLFPTAAVTNATSYMYMGTGKNYYNWLFYVQLAGLLILTIYLLWKTIRLAMKHSLCLKEENSEQVRTA